MASLLGFPSSPSSGQQYSVGNNSYVWTGLVWQKEQPSSETFGSIPVYSQDPSVSTNGKIYLNSTSGRVRVFFNEWMNLSTLEELLSHRHTYSGNVVFPSPDMLDIDGGTPSTTIFDMIIDGGIPGEIDFSYVVDSGTIA